MAKKKRIEKKITLGEGENKRRVSVYGYSAYEINQKAEALKAKEYNKQFPFFETIADEWEDEHFPEIAIGTQVCYTPALKRAKQEFKDMRISEITTEDVENFLQDLAALKFSEQTVKVQKAVINLIFTYAQRKSITKYNPVPIARLPKNLNKNERTLPNDTDIKKIIDSVDEDFGLFPFFLLLTGCRRGEALALKWDDIDFDKKVINISKNVIYNGNKPIINDHTKTAAGMRTIVLLDVLSDKLLQYKEICCTEYIFGNRDTPYTQTHFKRRWDKYVNKTGVNLTPHQLRHAYATILYEANVDEKAAQTLMGHSKISITQDIYTHIRQSKAANIQNTLNSYVVNNVLQK